MPHHAGPLESPRVVAATAVEAAPSPDSTARAVVATLASVGEVVGIDNTSDPAIITPSSKGFGSVFYCGT